MLNFRETLREQRWDDHRYYHHSRINQALHLVSAMSFLVAYACLFFDPPLAAIIAWLIGMTTRQCGHFFFEPRGYDHINQATHEHKEEIKVGYNLQRKVILMAIWALMPLMLLADPTLLGWRSHRGSWSEIIDLIGIAWLILGIGGVLFRMAQLYALQSSVASLAWGTKILTDPFHDIKLYWRAPLHLWRGELLDFEDEHETSSVLQN